MTKEMWLPAPEFEGYYEVSNTGHVRRTLNPRKTRLGYLSPVITAIGYERVGLHGQGEDATKLINVFVHRLVAKAFVPNPGNKPETNHKNGIKTDNRAENLEWCTRSENELHAYASGLAKRGSGHGNAKIDENDVKTIRKLRKEGVSLPQLSAKFSLSQSALSSICHYKVWKHVA